MESSLSGSKDAGNRVGTPKCHLAAFLLLSLPRGSPTQQGVIDNDTLHPTQMQHQPESGHSELPTPTPKPESSLWTDTPQDQRTGRTQLSIFSSPPDSRYMQLRRKEAEMRNQKKNFKPLNQNLKYPFSTWMGCVALCTGGLKSGWAEAKLQEYRSCVETPRSWKPTPTASVRVGSQSNL